MKDGLRIGDRNPMICLKKNEENKMKIKKTHIPRLDDLLNGGIPEGMSMVFLADPGIPSDIFGYQIIGERMKNNGEKTFIYTNSATPNSIIDKSYNFGWNFEEDVNTKKLFFVDSVSCRVGVPGEGKYNISSDSETEDIISKALDEIPGGTGIIMDMALLFDSIGIGATLDMVKKLNKAAKEKDVNLIYIFTKWEYADEVFESLRALVDCEIRIQPIAERVIFKQIFRVMKSHWTEHSDMKIFFEAIAPGGVKVFIPKLLVTGPYNAGKTSFVKRISDESVSVERQAFESFPTTVALDFGHLEHKGFSADVFGTPGQERFDLLLSTLAREAMGTFIVVDSTKPDTFPRANDMIGLCRVEAIPKVIVANKQDLEGALLPDEIREAMKISKDIPIVPTSIVNDEGIEDTLNSLLDMIYR
jgi:small GTP-binding protein